MTQKGNTLDEILDNAKKYIQRFEDDLTKLSGTQQKTINGFQGIEREIGKYSAVLESVRLATNTERWTTKKNNIARQEELRLTQQINQERYRAHMRLEKEHQEGVQRNIRLRESYKSMEVSLGRLTQMFGGIPLRGLPMMGVGGMMGLTMAQMEETRISRRKRSTAEDVRRVFHDRGINESERKEKMDDLFDVLGGLDKEQKALNEKDAHKLLDSNPTLRAMAKRLERVGEFLSNHKNGVIISVVSLGVLVGLFKSMMSVSPMLTKMLELMGMTFGLILRPFGDFIGFFLRPIAIMFLQSVLPFFQEMYPMMMELGTIWGESTVDAILATADWLNQIHDFLKNNTAFFEYAPWVLGAAVPATLTALTVNEMNKDKTQKPLTAQQMADLEEGVKPKNAFQKGLAWLNDHLKFKKFATNPLGIGEMVQSILFPDQYQSLVDLRNENPTGFQQLENAMNQFNPLQQAYGDTGEVNININNPTVQSTDQIQILTQQVGEIVKEEFKRRSDTQGYRD